ncbi:hypothetical protein [Paenibacillus sp. MMS18-CY102]|uniref:hypothetical protein n=1 Tax=Paenibacillus sp. MMS18-CY102 TaxID=2682849 RepID=UPI001365A6DD|nr:hypothetical protein [Paenibacillus sp. MMS18-CY102]MWC30411.1 hypothetical protein [Paenibacillus sp. MMS18-CY102]
MWRRRRMQPWLRLMGLAAVVVFVGWLTIGGLRAVTSQGSADGAAQVVEQFYELEQSGDFGSSWELFHPVMQEHFTKDKYIQQRAHILMQDFQSKTFEFSIGSPKPVGEFRATQASEPLQDVYKIEVTQSFHSLYGPFELVQDCYAVKVDGKWTLLWQWEAKE